MVEKLTKEFIIEAIEEELENLEEVGMLSGIGSAIGGMAKDVKGKFQKHRAPAVAQKLGQKYGKELRDLSNEFVGVADSFEKDYNKWKSNPFLKKILDGLEFEQSMDVAADGINDVNIKLDGLTSGNFEPVASASSEKPQKPGVVPQQPMDDDNTNITQVKKKRDWRGATVAPSVKQNMPEALQQIKSILKENKKIRIIKTNGQEK